MPSAGSHSRCSVCSFWPGQSGLPGGRWVIANGAVVVDAGEGVAVFVVADDGGLAQPGDCHEGALVDDVQLAPRRTAILPVCNPWANHLTELVQSSSSLYDLNPRSKSESIHGLALQGSTCLASRDRDSLQPHPQLARHGGGSSSLSTECLIGVRLIRASTERVTWGKGR